MMAFSMVPLSGCLELNKENDSDDEDLPETDLKNMILKPKTLKFTNENLVRNLSYLQEDDDLSYEMKGGCLVTPPPIVLTNFSSYELANQTKNCMIENLTLQVKYRTVSINSSDVSWLNHVQIVRDGLAINTTILPMDHDVEDVDECVLEEYSDFSSLLSLEIRFEWPHQWGQGVSRFYFDYIWIIVNYREIV
jgi:hypothetical protein